jgi:hypothetical protein
MPFSDTEEGHDHRACRRVALARWVTMLVLLGFLLVNCVFCLLWISGVRKWLESHAQYVYARDAKWEPMITETYEFVRQVREVEKIRSLARAKVEAEREAAAEAAKKSPR